MRCQRARINGLGQRFCFGRRHPRGFRREIVPQCLLRTDDMEYHIRPLDHKHPVILPVGKEGEFKISKDLMEMRVPDGDHKNRRYQVVSMKPIDHPEPLEGEGTKTKYDPSRKGDADRPPADKTRAEKTDLKTPAEPPSPVQ